MTKSITIFILVIMICLPAEATRTLPFSFNLRGGVSRSSSVADDNGICKSEVETQGYVCEEHTVTTEDGYILSMQRIPVGRSGKKPDKPPVLLQHGLLIDASTWLLNSPDESLAFILADNGFDVWLANTRGTKYSRQHTSLSPNESAYWDWSWDELAAYDLPAFVQYVHDQTGQKLHYVGHSLGTSMALAAFSQEKLLDMVRSAGLLCPIAYMGQLPSQLAKASADAFLAEAAYKLGLYEFIPGGDVVGKLLEDICHLTHSNCTNLMTAFTGNSCCVNSSRVDFLLEHEPQPTATKNMIHLSQMVRKGTIAMYDFGSKDENKKHYGKSTPPLYNMSSIPNNFPIFIGYGGQDMLADVKDVHTLLNSLQDHDADKLVLIYNKEYAHADFVFGVNAKQIVYDPLMAFFKLQ